MTDPLTREQIEHIVVNPDMYTHGISRGVLVSLATMAFHQLLNQEGYTVLPIAGTLVGGCDTLLIGPNTITQGVSPLDCDDTNHTQILPTLKRIEQERNFSTVTEKGIISVSVSGEGCESVTDSKGNVYTESVTDDDVKLVREALEDIDDLWEMLPETHPTVQTILSAKMAFERILTRAGSSGDVPEEPTEEMIDAVMKNIGKWPHNPDGSVSVREQFKSDYACAIAAIRKIKS